MFNKKIKKTEIKTGEPTASLGRKPGQFRYYLHDHSRSFRLQLFGHLTSANLPELQGCWNTAKSSVAGRKISVDVKKLESADEAGRQWLQEMVKIDGAEIVGSPESATFLSGIIPSAPTEEKTRLVNRLLRRSVVKPSPSPEQAKTNVHSRKLGLEPSQ